MSSLSTLPKGDSAWLLRKAIERIMEQVSVLETNIGSSTTGNSANTQIIFNDNGTLRGDTGLVFNKTTDALTVTGLVTAGSATITGDLTVDTSTLKVDSTNNRVGIVQATPLYPLHLVGEFGLQEESAGNGSKLRFIGQASQYNFRLGKQLTATNAFEITPSTAPGGTTFSNPVYTVTYDGTHTFLDGAGGTRMTLNSTGLGIGMAPVSGEKLSVNGPVFINSGNALKLSNVSGNYVAQILNTAGSGQGNFAFVLGASTPMTLDASGRLLVGTVTSGTAAGDGIVKLGTYGHCVSQTGVSIASGSSVDLTVITSGAGYQGFLSVANTQDGNANVRTQTTFSVFGRGTSSTITQIATADGSTGAASFTVTTPSNGVIRITNTSGAAATISTQFFGGSSA